MPATYRFAVSKRQYIDVESHSFSDAEAVAKRRLGQDARFIGPGGRSLENSRHFRDRRALRYLVSGGRYPRELTLFDRITIICAGFVNAVLISGILYLASDRLIGAH